MPKTRYTADDLVTVPLVGIACPYTNPDPVTNMRIAARFATKLWEAADGKFVPNLPIANMMWDLIAPLPYEAWLTITMAAIERCDAVVRLPGESSGADLETARADKLGIPVLYAHHHDLDKPGGALVQGIHTALAHWHYSREIIGLGTRTSGRPAN